MNEPGTDVPHGQSFVSAEVVAALTARVWELEKQVALLRRDPAVIEPLHQVASEPVPVPAGSEAPPIVPLVFGSVQPPPVVKEALSLENRLGSQVFNRIGIVALLIGSAWALKLAIDNHLIGPVGRILIGLLAGAGLVLWSERFRRKGFAAFSYSLKAIGTGMLYLSLWAAFQLYHLLPAGVALLAMVLVSAWNAYMAWAQDAELLGAYALTGGMATPLLLSTGGDHEVFLFTYLLAINVATVLLVRLKGWSRLLLGAVPATIGYFIGWYARFYSQEALGITSAFVLAFFAVFLLPSIGLTPETGHAAKSRWRLLPRVFLPLINAASGSLALYSVLQDAGFHDWLPWLMVLFAALYLCLVRVPSPAVTTAVHLSLAVVFLTIAIPLKLSGAWITVAWLVEGVALLWAAVRLESREGQEDGGGSVLRWLACTALLLGFFGVMFQLGDWYGYRSAPAFANRRFGTALVGVAAFAAAVFIARKAGPSASRLNYRTVAAGAVVALNLTAVLAVVGEISTLWNDAGSASEGEFKKALAISAFLMLYGAGLLAIGFWRRSAFLRWQALLLLVFTIAKTFLFDTRNLGQGYRVMSFLGLGVLLMAVSFAYQKDWLSLREGSNHDESNA